MNKTIKIDYEEQVKLAEDIARKVHKGQIRKFGLDKGKPYIIHLERIANSLNDPLLKAAAWLHDTCEDANIGFEDLANNGICEEVIEIVDFVTKKYGENYLDFIMRIIKNYRAVEVKMADLLDNMSSLDEGSMKDKYRLAYWILDNRKYIEILL